VLVSDQVNSLIFCRRKQRFTGFRRNPDRSQPKSLDAASQPLSVRFCVREEANAVLSVNAHQKALPDTEVSGQERQQAVGDHKSGLVRVGLRGSLGSSSTRPKRERY